MRKNAEPPKRASELADELIARAMVVLEWPVIESRVEAGPGGLQVVLAPAKEWTREGALEALDLAHSMKRLAFQMMCPAGPEPKARARRGRGTAKS